MTMKHFTILGKFSSVRSPAWSSTVVPLSSDDLVSSCNGFSAMHLLYSVANSILLQKNVAEIASDPNMTLPDPIQDCIEDGVEILDVCNFLLEKIGLVKNYAESVNMAVHLIKPGMAPVAVKRVKELLDKRRYKTDDVDQCRSRMKRLLKRRRSGGCDVLTWSMADALDTCRIVGAALSLKSCERGSMEQMVELRDVMECAKRVRDLTAEKGGEVDTWHVERMKMKCESLVEGVEVLEPGGKSEGALLETAVCPHEAVGDYFPRTFLIEFILAGPKCIVIGLYNSFLISRPTDFAHVYMYLASSC